MINFFKVDETISDISFLLRPEMSFQIQKNSPIQVLIVSPRETLVERESTSNDTIKQFEL